MLTNQRQANPGNIAVGVAGFYLPDLQPSHMKPHQDPSAARTERLKHALSDLARDENTRLITPQFRKEYKQSKDRAATLAKRLKELRSFEYLGERRVASNEVERLGVPVKRLCFYRMIAGDETRYYTFFLTPDDRVAFYHSTAQ